MGAMRGRHSGVQASSPTKSGGGGFLFDGWRSARPLCRLDRGVAEMPDRLHLITARAHSISWRVMVATAVAITFVATGSGCERTDANRTPSAIRDSSTAASADGDMPTTTAPATASDMAGIFDACIDRVIYTIESPDGVWSARRICEHLAVEGRGIRIERPNAYPISFSPASNALLFVANGPPVVRRNRRGIPYEDLPARALYLLRLPPSENDFGARLMNASEGTGGMIEPPSPPNLQPSPAIGTWTSPGVFQYTISIPQHPEFDGIFAVDIETPRPEVIRVR